MPKQMSGGNGGIMGSGIFGMFGTIIQCKDSDTSFFCNFMKAFNIFIVVLFLLFIFYNIYIMFIAPAFKKRR
jgi:hypothetical protein